MDLGSFLFELTLNKSVFPLARIELNPYPALQFLVIMIHGVKYTRVH